MAVAIQQMMRLDPDELQVFWNDSVGVWLDYDLESKKHRNRFYPSNVFPLMTKNISIKKVTKVINYLDQSGALKFKGCGIFLLIPYVRN